MAVGLRAGEHLGDVEQFDLPLSGQIPQPAVDLPPNFQMPALQVKGRDGELGEPKAGIGPMEPRPYGAKVCPKRLGRPALQDVVDPQTHAHMIQGRGFAQPAFAPGRVLGPAKAQPQVPSAKGLAQLGQDARGPMLVKIGPGAAALGDGIPQEPDPGLKGPLGRP